VPLALLLKVYRRRINTQVAVIGVTYLLCELASSMTKKVWNFKFTAALSAVIISILCELTLSSIRKTEAQ
jgi:hypothetical protein